jgi:photoactive yellow protein
MSFVPNDMLGKLGRISREEADRLPFGVVKVDASGRILLYNHYEAQLAGVAPSTAEGKNFFTEIAPCTNNKLFFGRFKKGIEQGELDAAFSYTFTYKMKPTNVAIQMKHDKETGTNWVFVQAKAA